MRLQGHDLEQLVGVGADIGAARRVLPGWDPPQPEQPEHMVDPQAAGMSQLRVDRLDERSIRRRPQPGRNEWRQPPILARRVETIRWRADAGAHGELTLPIPGIEA